MTALPTLKARVKANFPTSVLGTGGIKVTKTGGVWTIQADFGSLSSTTASAITNTSQKDVWVYDTVTGVYNVITLSELATLFAGVRTGTSSVLDFGSFPGAGDTSLAITGQTDILSNSIVEAWIVPVATADHSADEHIANPPRVYAGNISAGVGFTIYGVNDDRIGSALTYGKWSVNWRWQ